MTSGVVPRPFALLLKQAVETYAFRTGMKKQAIARACGYSPSMLSHMIAGKRMPGSRQAVVALGRFLDLSRDATNELLSSLQYALLTDAEIAAAVVERHVGGIAAEALPQPERDLLTLAVDQDLSLLGEAWRHYIDLRDELQRRNWPEVALRAEVGRESYRQLQAASSRFAAWLELSDAEAHQYQERLDDAKAACRRGLAAAQVSQSPAARCLLTVKLADVEKLQGDLHAADSHYREAQTILETWTPQVAIEQRFKQHWKARIQREQGNLLLFMALPSEAHSLLQSSLAYFSGLHQKYEEARICHSLGWASHLLGDWDMSRQWRLRAIELGDELEQERGWRDPLSELQDDLYLGLLLEDEGDFDGAEEKLGHALRIATTERAIWQIHELGLIYVALSRIYRANWSKHDLAQSEWYARQGVEFHEQMATRDPMRMAIAYNALGDLLIDQGHIHEGRMAFEQALQWSRSSNPPNPYYEASARLRCARAFLLASQDVPVGASTAQLTLIGTAGDTVAASTESGSSRRHQLLSDSLDQLANAEELCLKGNYWQLLARVKVSEAATRLAEASDVSEICCQAIGAALHSNRFVFRQTLEAIEHLDVATTQRDTLRKRLNVRMESLLEDVPTLSPDKQLPNILRSLLKEART